MYSSDYVIVDRDFLSPVMAGIRPGVLEVKATRQSSDPHSPRTIQQHPLVQRHVANVAPNALDIEVESQILAVAWC